MRSRVFSLAALLGLLGTASAEDPIEPVDPAPIIGELETFVVTPSRVEESTFETPFVVESLQEDELIERAVRSVPHCAWPRH